MSEENGAAQQPPQQRIEVRKIYLKDVSLETPNSPQIFAQTWKPEVNLQLASQTAAVGENLFEVVLRLTITAKLEDKTAYLIEVQQAGLFTIAGFAEQQLGLMQGAFCPNLLFPYAREAVDNLAVKAGFPAVNLAPVNFEALYMQRLKQSQQETAGSPAQPN